MSRHNEAELLSMYEQQLVNTDLLLDFWKKQGLLEKYEMGYVCTMAHARNILLDITNKKKYRKLWRRTYPELNRLIFWDNKNHPSSYRNKIWFVAVSLGLFPSCQRYLLSKCLRPSAEWRVMMPRKRGKSLFVDV